MQQVNAPSVRWEWIGEAWNLFTKQWSVWVVMMLVTVIVVGLIYLPLYFIAVFSMVPSVSDDGVVTTGSGFLPIVLFPVMYLAVVCAVSWLFGGLYSAAFKQIRGEQIAVGDLFSGGRYFSRMIGALILIGIASGIGGIFCLIPGLIVSGLAFLTAPMIVEGGKGTIDAIKASIEVTKKDWIMFTLFAVALAFIAGAGGIACGVGALATYPLLFLGHALAYRDLVGMPGAHSQGQFMPPPPPPDYRDYAPAQTPAPPQSPAWTPPSHESTPAPESAAKTCPHCGATLARAVNFCNQCGRPLRGA
jgi:zinc ribbon protein